MKNSSHTSPIFTDPLTPAMQQLLDRATAVCAEHGARMTPQRREILGLILSAQTPVGAYDLLERIKAPDRKPAPPTVYRALDFLLEQGLIHRIERLSAFVPCTHLLHDQQTPECTHNHDHDSMCLHTAQFLICRSCRSVTEITTPKVLESVRQACRDEGFVVKSTSIEIEGLCASCAAGTPQQTPHASHS
ncbi:transcriptional repressor [Acetobacter cibinongensis]|uniref:Transcriptional regulator ferric uptake Fur n=1 Tax=Acetobacter cibinongensis TaxID=146475 RepID=A0A0D6N0T6_9PROT|nr:Fur family transcriptional regulator [Acetobacter cibinongensis]GAN59183.1 transcriptional regulator ferric uptake Fur [Acetobacter cibinongensis]GBQ19206.1 Fur family transcriptional regulator [Acetobacter cibinongensis NRIC 0482]GEL59561.1 transcriptional repressor [Acetobacter cibinongensis]